MKKIYWQIPFLLFLVIGTIYIINRQHNTPYQRIQGFVFGTTYHITYQGEENLQQEIEAELRKVDLSLSTFNEKSVISRINRNESMQTDGMFRTVFEKARTVSQATDGAFDITVAPLVNVWGFGFKNSTRPSAHTIDSLKALIGYRKVTLKGHTIRKEHPDIMLDCSAIAKGFGVDVVAAFLNRKGIDNFMVEIGGEVVTRGINPNRKPWQIGITKPVDDSLNVQQDIQTIIRMENKALATSGNYRNFYYKGGKKYAHTIDPATGYPVQHSLLSATVIADDCATADAYATAFMVTGIDKAKAILNKHPELVAYFIYADGGGRNAVWFSPTLKKLIEQ